METKFMDIKKAARRLRAYLKDRALVEKVSFELTQKFFEEAIPLYNSFFGIYLDEKGNLLRDRQEPTKGYLEKWIKEHPIGKI